MVVGQQFSRAESVTLDSTGAGEADIYPPGADWVITLSTVSTSTATSVPVARIYRNAVSEATFIEGSYTGSNDSSNTRTVLRAGEGILCVWSGGDAGARATFRVSGVQYPSGQAPLE